MQNDSEPNPMHVHVHVYGCNWPDLAFTMVLYLKIFSRLSSEMAVWSRTQSKHTELLQLAQSSQIALLQCKTKPKYIVRIVSTRWLKVTDMMWHMYMYMQYCTTLYPYNAGTRHTKK